MRISARLLMMVMATLTAAAATSAYAGAVPVFNLTLTENSSTSLSLSYNGPSGSQAFSVLNTAPDQWTITIDPNSFVSLNNFDYFWQEPEDTINKANEVLHSTVTNPARSLSTAMCCSTLFQTTLLLRLQSDLTMSPD